MKIFDCFTFFNELELLDIRLQLLNDYVDYFVICEIKKTYTGKDKELYFQNNKDRYKDYLHKIIYITSEDIPDVSGFKDWSIAHFQRNCLFYGLNGKCDLDDIVLVSDLDELPNPTILQTLKNTEVKLFQNNGSRSKQRQRARLFYELGERRFLSTMFLGRHRNINDILDFMPVAFEQKLCVVYMNLVANKKWHGTVASKWKLMMSPQKMRDDRNRLPYIENGGWHFSYLGGADRIRTKLDSIVDGRNENNSRIIQDIEELKMKGTSHIIQDTKELKYSIIEPNRMGLPESILKYVKEHYSNFLCN